MTVEEQIAAAEHTLAPMFERIDKIALFNQEKVLKAFREERIALRHFVPTTGYGYGDEGRESLGKVYARAFGAERAVGNLNRSREILPAFGHVEQRVRDALRYHPRRHPRQGQWLACRFQHRL